MRHLGVRRRTAFLFRALDWRVRDAVLADLTRSSFPIGYNIDGVDYILRAPLGMYMFPAAVGHVFGCSARTSPCWRKTP